MMSRTEWFPNNTVNDVRIREVFPFTEEGVTDKIHFDRKMVCNFLGRAGDWGNC